MSAETKTLAWPVVQVDDFGQPDVQRCPVPGLLGVAVQLQVQRELPGTAVLDHGVRPSARDKSGHQGLRGTSVVGKRYGLSLPCLHTSVAPYSRAAGRA